MAVFEKVVHGNLKDVIQNTDMLLKCDTGQFYLYYVAISG